MHITAISLLSFLFSFVFRVNEIAKLRGPTTACSILVYIHPSAPRKERERERERKKKFGELKEEKEIFHSYYTYPRDLAWQSRCTTAAVLLILCSFRTSQTSLPLLVPPAPPFILFSVCRKSIHFRISFGSLTAVF